GLYHGGLLIVERVARQHFGFEPKGLPGQVWTFAAVLVGWVFFRATSMTQAMTFLQKMTFLAPPHAGMLGAINFLRPDTAFYLALGLTLALVPLSLPRTIASSTTMLATQRLATFALFIV